jgi:hypothetical protein
MEFWHVQIKCGNTLKKEEVSLGLSNDYIAKRYALLVQEIANKWGSSYTISHKKIFVTSKRVYPTLQQTFKDHQIELHLLDTDSPYLPKRK